MTAPSPTGIVPPPASTWPLFKAWLIAATATVAWDATGLDMAVMHGIGSSSGFALRQEWWLETVLHTGLREAAAAVYLMLWVWALWPARWHGTWHPLLSRRARWAALVAVSASLALVSLLKHFSLTSCPWDLKPFGGMAWPVSHWRLGTTDGGPGHCFPGGHASSGFGFLAMALPWSAAPRDGLRDQRTGRWWLLGSLACGLLAGLVQTLRGAHFPSHTLWTLLICGGVSLMVWHVMKPWCSVGLRPV